MKSVSIIGSNGQLGSDLVKVYEKAGWRVNRITHELMCVEEITQVSNVLSTNPTDWIVNTAALLLEDSEKNSELAWEINSKGAKNVAEVANKLGSKCVFISTDFVFDGKRTKGESYTESDLVSPINVYGHTKASGEALTLSANPRNVVARISSVFGAAGSRSKGGNFIETILKKARAGEELKIVNDISMSPTYAQDAAVSILKATSSDYEGILHCSNEGETTWQNLAAEAIKMLNIHCHISPAVTNQSSIPNRPMNSVLSTERRRSALNFGFDWEDGLNRYLSEKGYLN
jgi:dTDP-4-dehydrorhamnose reductase